MMRGKLERDGRRDPYVTDEIAWQGIVGTMDCYKDRRDPIEYFYSNWKIVKPYETSAITRAIKFAEERDLPLDLPRHRVGYKRFLQFVHAFCSVNGGSPRFYLSQRTAGEALGVDSSMARQYIKSACRDGYLRPVKRHDRKSRLATEYEADIEAILVLAGQDLGPRAVD